MTPPRKRVRKTRNLANWQDPVIQRFLAIFVLLLASTVAASAHREPADCQGGIGLQMLLSAFRLDGSVANTISNGEKVIYIMQVKNNGTAGITACDVTCATVLLQCPDINGNPGAPTIVASNFNLPYGTAPFTAGSVTCTVATASGVVTARAIAQVFGVVHDLSIPNCSADGTCITNFCDPDVSSVERVYSVHVQSPAVFDFTHRSTFCNFAIFAAYHSLSTPIKPVAIPEFPRPWIFAVDHAANLDLLHEFAECGLAGSVMFTRQRSMPPITSKTPANGY